MTSPIPRQSTAPVTGQSPIPDNLPLPPGPKGHRLRNLRERVLDFRGFMSRLHEEYGAIVLYRLPAMFGDFCAVFDADLIKEFMTTRYTSYPPFQDKASYGVMKNPGVFRSDGEQHLHLHDVIAEAFGEENMPFHVEIMLRHIPAMTARWRDGQVIDGRDEMARLVSGVMLESIYGRDTKVTAAHAQETLWAMKWDWALSHMPVKTEWLRAVPIPQNRRRREAIETMDDMTYATIRRARDSGRRGRDVISHFVRASDHPESKRLGILDSPDKIRDEVYSITLGNSDPPLNALVHLIHYLGRNPAVRERLEREVDEVLGGRPIVAGDFDRLPYARAVFRETVRLSPPAYGGNGQLRTAREDCVLGGYLIPQGTTIHPCAGIPHRRPEDWEHADEFLPERWLADAGPAPESRAHAYMPFGLAPRACPGSQYATVLSVLALATFVREFRLDPVSPEPPKPETLGVGVQGPYGVRVTKRAAGVPRVR